MFPWYSSAGVSTFVPKFVQFQFNKTASEAAFMVGTVAVPGAVGGQLVRAINACSM